jgi:hypothetical protein
MYGRVKREKIKNRGLSQDGWLTMPPLPFFVAEVFVYT